MHMVCIFRFMFYLIFFFFNYYAQLLGNVAHTFSGKDCVYMPTFHSNLLAGFCYSKRCDLHLCL